MRNDAFQILGLCRRANKLSMGHDMCKNAVRSKKARLCLISADASQRVYEEFQHLCAESSVPVFRIKKTNAEIHRLTGYRAGVLTVDDSGFAESIMKHFTQNTFAEVETYD